ncbi:hypothetical protein JKP88DRAFT_164282 [Tribonema minus]|uniref:Inner centromere protein ARK-binding domain-containing protein n=1 Tax=Tribonema minus TaxID=303371 RepID=A0A836CEJ8_9STRA|nr:hypothetical protein JKP88DRAFT_164282 [Tribonema minus]
MSERGSCSDDDDEEESDGGDSDGGGGGGGGGGGKAGGTPRPRPPRKHVPEWAKGSQLKRALEAQYARTAPDPDTIFDDVTQSCNLETIFARKSGRYGKRGSSANWAADKLTPAEVMTYKRAARGGGGGAAAPAAARATLQQKS